MAVAEGSDVGDSGSISSPTVGDLPSRPVDLTGVGNRYHHGPKLYPMNRLDGVGFPSVGSQAAIAAREGSDEAMKREMRDLVDLLSKLNPMAEEFVPPSISGHGGGVFPNGGAEEIYGKKINNKFVQWKRRMNNRTSLAQREDVIRRTIYVTDIDHQVTEECLASLFINCGQVVDCRICGDPNSVLRFAFIEFTHEEGAMAALSLSGTVLGFYPVRVLRSKTAIAPVNPTFLPQSDDEHEMCGRTIYCTNIDTKVLQVEIKLFFESICGEVHRLRMLGDQHHPTRIAFVEFATADSATAALNCSGVVLGSLPIRVSPSKTPIRTRSARPLKH